MKLLILIVMFLGISALLIISNNSLALYSSKNISIFFSNYLSWLTEIKNNFQSITGNIISMKWIPR